LLTLRILAPEGAILEKENLSAVNVPLVDGGSIGIRSNHTPLIAETSKGAIQFRSDISQGSIELYPGVLHIDDNIVVILTAGEMLQKDNQILEPADTEFDRLLQTLTSDFDPETIIKDK
jgi:F0F1-type ATP synthase epsilon subunit